MPTLFACEQCYAIFEQFSLNFVHYGLQIREEPMKLKTKMAGINPIQTTRTDRCRKNKRNQYAWPANIIQLMDHIVYTSCYI